MKPIPNVRVAMMLALAGLGLALAPFAHAAGCAAVPNHAGATVSLLPASPHLSPVLFRKDGDDQGRPEPIVGLWHVIYTSAFDDNFPPGNAMVPPFQFLESFKTWHADGTEFENAFLSPAGGDICFGVWKSLGRNTVKLHHVGLMFNPDNGEVSAFFTVDEIDVVAEDGKTYRGEFDFKLFPPTDIAGTGTPIAEVKGTTAANRITVE